MGICKLCLQEKELIKKSHIITDFLYNGLYDEKHKINKLIPSEFVKGNIRVSRPSTGEYEGNLLCVNCDNHIIGQYESYSRIAFLGGKLPAYECPTFSVCKNSEGLDFTYCEHISYKKFKLFLLSILWRADISQRDFFRSVNLGEDSNIIRDMIYNGNPGIVEDYPILLHTYINDKQVPSDIIGVPTRIENDQRIMYVFVISGFVILYHLSKQNIPERFIKYTIQPSNEAFIFHLPIEEGQEFLLKYFGID